MFEEEEEEVVVDNGGRLQTPKRRTALYRKDIF